MSVSSTRVAKLYHDHELADGGRHPLRKKVQALMRFREAVRSHRALEGVVWPECTLHDERGHFVGYSMRRAPGRPLAVVVRDPALMLAARVGIAQRIAQVFAALHAVSAAVGDPSATNILVGDGGDLAFIDADSFDLPGFPAGFVTRRYQRPEVLRGEVADVAGEAADSHALAFLLFEVFSGGWSPFAHQGGEDPESNIKKGLFACGFEPSLAPAAARAGWSGLPRALQDLFRSSFAATPERRPRAADWVSLLTTVSFVTGAPATPVAPAALAATNERRPLLGSFWSKRTA